MGFLEKWSPSADLERLRHEFDELLERFGFDHGEFKAWPTGSKCSAIESSIDGNKFVVRVDSPGVDPKNMPNESAPKTVKIQVEEKKPDGAKKAA